MTYHILTLPIDSVNRYNYHMKALVHGYRLEAVKVVVNNQSTVELPAQYKSPLVTPGSFKYYKADDVTKYSSGTAQNLFDNGPIKGVLYRINGEDTDTPSDDPTPVSEGATISGGSAEYYVVYTYDASNEIAKLDGSVKYNIRTKYKDNKVWKDRGFFALNRGRNNRPAVLPTDNLNPEMLSSEDFMVALVTGTGVSPYWKDGNNKNKEAKSMMENAPDAIGINIHVAGRLSGADFDGDTVTAIPLSSKVKITATKQLKQLEGFDPRAAYPPYEGMTKVGPKTDGFRKGLEMGKSTNLIADMTLKGAPPNDIARAVKYAQVVIDAEKHQLDWKRCYEEQGIADLKRKWQDNGDGKVGASTIISRAKSPTDIPLRKARTGISPLNTNPETGEKIERLEDDSKRFYDELKPVRVKDANGRYLRDSNGDYVYETTVDKNGVAKIKKAPTGKILERTATSTKMAEAKDAYTLTSGGSKQNPGYLKEGIYAEYANTMKDLANKARKEYLATPNLKRDPDAAKKYSVEVDSLNSKLTEALKNAPRERQAQLLGNQIYAARKQANPDREGDSDWESKTKAQCLSIAREQVGAKKKPVTITAKEWEAIQSGAISESKLKTILNNTKSEDIKKLATPKESRSISEAKINTAKRMYKAGYTLKEIADKFGVSASYISEAVNGKEE